MAAVRSPALLAASAVLLLQIAALMHPGPDAIDHEELYNATSALEALHGHASRLLHFQYRPFCGGCTLNTGLGMALFAVLPNTLLTWKLIPIGYAVALAFVGFVALDRWIGRAAAVCFALIVAFPPRAWLHLSLIAWGNHYESGVIAAMALIAVAALRADARVWRSGFVGLFLAFGIWVGFSAIFAAVSAMIVLLAGRRWRQSAWVALGTSAVGVVWFLQYTITDVSPFETIYYSGEQVPRLARIPAKLWTLVAPRQLAALFGRPEMPWGWALGWGWAASLLGAAVWAIRRGPRLARLAVVFLGVWLVIYIGVRFEIYTPPSPLVAVPGSVRYAAPIYPIAFVLIGTVAGTLWRTAHRRWALALMAPALAAGISARVPQWLPPFPSAAPFRVSAADYGYFRRQGSYLISREEHRACTSTEPASQRFHAYALGWETAREKAEDSKWAPRAGELSPPDALPRSAYFEGVGAAMADVIDPLPKGDIATITRVATRMAALEAEDLQTALRELAWRHAEALTTNAVANGEMNSGVVKRLMGGVDTSPPEVRDAVLHAVGRRWTWIVAPWFLPGPLPFPDTGQANLEAFAEGYGEGLGEKWGPSPGPLYLHEFPEAYQSAMQQGYLRGVTRRWRDTASDPPEISASVR